MLLNAEGLPIEYIDRIQVTLNPLLYPFINFEKRNIDPTGQLRLSFNSFYGMKWYLDIQAQRINPCDIQGSIETALYELISQRFFRLSDLLCMLVCMDRNIDSWVYEVRELEFAFDFESHAIQVLNPQALLHCKDTLYSVDHRRHKGRPTRKSILENYDRIARLKSVNRLAHKDIEINPFSRRIEFRLTKYNCDYRTLNNLSGTYHEVITRYIPYLAILYHRFFYGNVLVDTKDHPYFDQIYKLAHNNRTRYTGTELERITPRKFSNSDTILYMMMAMLNPTPSTDTLAELALQV